MRTEVEGRLAGKRPRGHHGATSPPPSATSRSAVQMTHTPPFGVLDDESPTAPSPHRGKSVGSKELVRLIEKVRWNEHSLH